MSAGVVYCSEKDGEGSGSSSPSKFETRVRWRVYNQARACTYPGGGGGEFEIFWVCYALGTAETRRREYIGGSPPLS